MRATHIKYGTRIEGNHLTFDEGDVLEWHVHTKEDINDAHIMIVVQGKLLVETRGHALVPIVVIYGEDKTEVWGGENVVVGPGALLDIPLDIEHQFTALDFAQIFTFAKEPMNEPRD